MKKLFNIFIISNLEMPGIGEKIMKIAVIF